MVLVVGSLMLVAHLPFLAFSASSSSSSGSRADFEEDFVHSFLSKPEKLTTSKRLATRKEGWVGRSQYENAVGVTIENWTNQKLEFPEDFISEGARDMWYKPSEVRRHTRDFGLLAHGVRGSQSRGSLCYLIEDSWPIIYICLGWESRPKGVHVLLAVTSKAMDYGSLLDKELNGLLMKDKMRFYKGTDQYVVAVTAREEEGGGILEGSPPMHLVLSVIPQRLDVWAWEKYYKQAEVLQRIDVELLPTEATPLPQPRNRPPIDELENQPGIFERKDLLTRGSGLTQWVGNSTERGVMTAAGGSVAIGVRLENWSGYTLTQPEFVPNYGSASAKLPVVSVGPGIVELAVLKQEQAATGVSGILRWRIGTTDTILSLMVSVPYSRHLYSSWVAAGLTKDDLVPDFSAMYSGTPDSAWFVRAEMGHSLEFSNGELILVVTSDPDTSRPVVRLAVVPRNPTEVAPSITHRLEGRPGEFDQQGQGGRGKEGDQSVMALRSSAVHASQCHCPCMGSGSSRSLCLLFHSLLLLLAIKGIH